MHRLPRSVFLSPSTFVFLLLHSSSISPPFRNVLNTLLPTTLPSSPVLHLHTLSLISFHASHSLSPCYNSSPKGGALSFSRLRALHIRGGRQVEQRPIRASGLLHDSSLCHAHLWVRQFTHQRRICASFARSSCQHACHPPSHHGGRHGGATHIHV
jgi:hypothetical protein